jgi:hypothetical protein
MKDIGWKRHTGRCDGFDWLDRQLASLPIGGLHGVFRAWLDNKLIGNFSSSILRSQL